MTNVDLAESLNLEFSLRGKSRVTVDVIRNWVRWRLLPRAIGSGRSIGQSRAWSRNEAALVRATQLTKLRIEGLARQDELRVQLWLEGADFRTEDVRRSLRRRTRSLIAKVLRRVSSTADPTEDELSPFRKRALRRQIGEQAEVFQRSALRMTDDEIIESYGLSRFGGRDADAFTKMLARMLPSLSLDQHQLALLNLGMVGSIGASDEIEGAALGAIKNATAAELELARRMFTLAMHSLELTESAELPQGAPSDLVGFQVVLRQVLPGISVGLWPVSMFSSLLNAVVKSPGKVGPLIKMIEESEAIDARIVPPFRSRWDVL